ncbi:hypothetical protein, conserved [Eimeria maxima]|uniref:Uncharacterized protein n=1 Tax=Eimeria maxima TaxID=5804 RepID=U6M5D2_EIMMA|nr:hypothetical protein, conserved [Eimeria maxima]CDJ58273.1 hypothetical protein, conserved [Eimeria maxima]
MCLAAHWCAASVQVFLIASDGLPGPSAASSKSAVDLAVSSLVNGSCCLCLRNVSLDAFLHLPLQQLLLRRWNGSLLTWRGPGGSAPCCGTATIENPGAPCPVIGDTGGDRNTASLQNDGVMILKLDRFTAQVLGLDTWIRLPHFMRKSLPPGTRYLKIDVQHPAVVRHQKMVTQNRLKRQMQGVQIEQGSSIAGPPSRLFEQLQRSLRSLEPVDLLSSTAPPEGDCGGVDARRELAEEVQLLLRASGSPTATCNIVQFQCRVSEYRGGILDMTAEASLAVSTASSSQTHHADHILMTPDLPDSQTPYRLVLPNPDSNMASRSHSCSELGESANTRQSPPIRPDYLGALQLLHERQRQWRENKLQQRSKDTQPAPENASHTEEALQMAAPPPFRKQPPAEALFSRITEYLGCLGLDIPVSKEDCDWFREADRMKDPQSIPVASVSGGLLHSTAVVAAAESLCTWLQSQGSGAWAAISVVGVAETAVAYTGQPHGSDASGESTLHMILSAEAPAKVRGMLLQTVAASDATTTMP